MPPRARTTDRSITTCRPCRRRKIRCGRERPSCNRCSETGAECVYEDQARQPIREYQFVKEIPGSAIAAEEATTSSIPNDRLRGIEALAERIHRMSRTLSAQTTATCPSASGVSTANPDSIPPTRTLVDNRGEIRPVQAALWTKLREDAAQLHEVLSQPIDEPTPGQEEPSEQLNREISVPVPEATLSFDPDPMLDSPPDIDWSYIDEVISGLHGPDTFEYEAENDGGQGESGGGSLGRDA